MKTKAATASEKKLRKKSTNGWSKKEQNLVTVRGIVRGTTKNDETKLGGSITKANK